MSCPVIVDDGNGGTLSFDRDVQDHQPGAGRRRWVLADHAAGTPVVVALLANDSDVDGDPLTVTSATLADPTHGYADPGSGDAGLDLHAGGRLLPATRSSTTSITDQDGADRYGRLMWSTVAQRDRRCSSIRRRRTGTPNLDPSDARPAGARHRQRAADLQPRHVRSVIPNGDALTFTRRHDRRAGLAEL